MASLNPQLSNVDSSPPDFKSTLDLVQQAQKQDIDAALQNLERAKQYTTVVVSLAYAGIFAIWNFCSVFIPSKATALIAILVGTSLALFVVFEICKMLAMQKITMRQFNSLNINPAIDNLDGLLRFVEEQKRRHERVSEDSFETGKWLAAIWPYFFYPTLICGFGGMFLLFYNVLAHLTGLLPFFPS